MVLEPALHRARAVARIERVGDGAPADRGARVDERVALAQATPREQLRELFVDDLRRDLVRQRLERHDLIDAVEQLDREEVADRLRDVGEDAIARSRRSQSAAAFREPRFDVMITTALAKLATSPAASVSRPSSNSWSRRWSACGCAFSISSSSTTQNGCARTREVSRPSGFQRSPIRRDDRVGARQLAHVDADEARLIAVEVLGDRGRELGLAGAGRSGEQHHARPGDPDRRGPARTLRITSAAARVAAGWPITRAANAASTSAGSSGSSSVRAAATARSCARGSRARRSGVSSRSSPRACGVLGDAAHDLDRDAGPRAPREQRGAELERGARHERMERDVREPDLERADLVEQQLRGLAGRGGGHRDERERLGETRCIALEARVLLVRQLGDDREVAAPYRAAEEVGEAALALARLAEPAEQVEVLDPQDALALARLVEHGEAALFPLAEIATCRRSGACRRAARRGSTRSRFLWIG